MGIQIVSVDDLFGVACRARMSLPLGVCLWLVVVVSRLVTKGWDLWFGVVLGHMSRCFRCLKKKDVLAVECHTTFDFD